MILRRSAILRCSLMDKFFLIRVIAIGLESLLPDLLWRTLRSTQICCLAWSKQMKSQGRKVTEIIKMNKDQLVHRLQFVVATCIYASFWIISKLEAMLTKPHREDLRQVHGQTSPNLLKKCSTGKIPSWLTTLKNNNKNKTIAKNQWTSI